MACVKESWFQSSYSEKNFPHQNKLSTTAPNCQPHWQLMWKNKGWMSHLDSLSSWEVCFIHTPFGEHHRKKEKRHLWQTRKAKVKPHVGRRNSTGKPIVGQISAFQAIHCSKHWSTNLYRTYFTTEGGRMRGSLRIENTEANTHGTRN